MVKTTIIARIADGLPLAASMDDEQVMSLFRMTTREELKLTNVFYCKKKKKRSKLN